MTKLFPVKLFPSGQGTAWLWKVQASAEKLDRQTRAIREANGYEVKTLEIHSSIDLLWLKIYQTVYFRVFTVHWDTTV